MPPLGGIPSPLTFQPASTGPGLRSFAVLVALAVLRRDPPATFEVSYLLNALEASSLSRPWLIVSPGPQARVSAPPRTLRT